MLSRALALVWLAAILAPGAAGAQESTPEDLAEARIHFERARGLEDDEQYERAADEYLSAYALYPNPEFFFNVGRVYRLADMPARALRYYRRYLELDPEGRGAEDARAQIEALEAEVGATPPEPPPDDDEPAKAPDDDEPAKAPDDDEPAVAPDTAADGDAPGQPAALDPSEGPSETGGASGGGSSAMRIAGIASGAAGVAALGASAYFGNRARTLSNEISAFVASDPPAWTEEMLGKYEDGQRANRRMYIAGGVGIAAVTAGAVLYFVGRDDGARDAPGVALAPMWTPGGATLTLGGAF